jgi:hypothetical protein
MQTSQQAREIGAAIKHHETRLNEFRYRYRDLNIQLAALTSELRAVESVPLTPAFRAELKEDEQSGTDHLQVSSSAVPLLAEQMYINFLVEHGAFFALDADLLADVVVTQALVALGTKPLPAEKQTRREALHRVLYNMMDTTFLTAWLENLSVRPEESQEGKQEEEEKQPERTAEEDPKELAEKAESEPSKLEQKEPLLRRMLGVLLSKPFQEYREPLLHAARHVNLRA